MEKPAVTEKEASTILKSRTNKPILTGKIVLAHLKETMDYSIRLEVVEIEGDILKAILAKDIKKVEPKYKKVAQAQRLLDKTIEAQLLK